MYITEEEGQDLLEGCTDLQLTIGYLMIILDKYIPYPPVIHFVEL